MRLMPFVDNFVWGVAVIEPSPIHIGESLSDVRDGSSFELKGLTLTANISYGDWGDVCYLLLGSNLLPFLRSQNAKRQFKRKAVRWINKVSDM